MAPSWLAPRAFGAHTGRARSRRPTRAAAELPRARADGQLGGDGHGWADQVHAGPAAEPHVTEALQVVDEHRAEAGQRGRLLQRLLAGVIRADREVDAAHPERGDAQVAHVAAVAIQAEDAVVGHVALERVVDRRHRPHLPEAVAVA